jgi:hypothetical protein
MHRLKYSIREAFSCWWNRRQLKAGTIEFRRGWDWAAGELLRGTPIDYIEDCVYGGDDRTQFDNGARAAIRVWERSRED